MANDSIKPVRMEVVIATTHFMPDRGVRLAKEALESWLSQFKPGSPLYREHGESVIGRVLTAGVRQRVDGEWELVGEIDVDLPAGEKLEDFLGRAMSISFIERDPDEPKATVAIGLDSMAFDQSDREELRRELAQLDDVRVARFHQFAEVPPPAIAIDLANNIIPVLQSAVGSGFWSTLTFIVSHYVANKRAKTTSLRFKVRGPGGIYLQAQVPANARDAVEVVEALFDGAAKLLREGQGARGDETGFRDAD